MELPSTRELELEALVRQRDVQLAELNVSVGRMTGLGGLGSCEGRARQQLPRSTTLTLYANFYLPGHSRLRTKLRAYANSSRSTPHRRPRIQ